MTASEKKLRDDIALVALASIIRKAPYQYGPGKDLDHERRAIAAGAYAYADAMLVARKKT